MPVKALMNWDKQRKNWYAMYRRHRLKVSPRKLGCPPTFEGSIEAANLWYRQRVAEIDGLPAASPSEVITEQMRDVLGRLGVDGLQQLARQGEAASDFLEM